MDEARHISLRSLLLVHSSRYSVLRLVSTSYTLYGTGDAGDDFWKCNSHIPYRNGIKFKSEQTQRLLIIRMPERGRQAITRQTALSQQMHLVMNRESLPDVPPIHQPPQTDTVIFAPSRGMIPHLDEFTNIPFSCMFNRIHDIGTQNVHISFLDGNHPSMPGCVPRRHT